VHEPSATDPEAEENNMFSTNISFWPKKKQKKNNHSNSFILPKIVKYRFIFYLKSSEFHRYFCNKRI
jgi:hypothetical protein